MHSRNCFSCVVKLPVPMAALLAAVVMVLLTGTSKATANDCKFVSTHLSSQQVATFSDGTPCPSPVCTEGRFTGGLNGKFRYIATGQSPASAVDANLPSSMLFLTGVAYLDTKFCGNRNQTGTLVLRDATSFTVTAVSPDLAGLFGDVFWVDGAASTGTCAGASGLLTGIGIFKAGCVDCDYEGKVCRP